MAGSERNITQLLTSIDPRTFQLFVACFISGELAQSMKARGFQVFALQRGSIYSINGLRNLAFLCRFVRENNISLVLTYHEGSDFCGLALSYLCNIPVISNRRDMGYKTKLHHRMAYKLFGRFFSGVIAVSNSVRKEIIKQGWFPENKILVIHNGTDGGKYKSDNNMEMLKGRIGIEPNHRVVGVIANLWRVKGIQYFIEAASIILRQNPEVEFMIIGEDVGQPGYTISELKTLAEELHVGKKIHFMGKRNDIEDLISIFDVGVVASLSEGFSNVILEYMASSKPVVATDVGGNREAVLPDETGLIVPPGNPHELAKAISFILGNRDIALRLGSAGRKRVEEEFSLGKMVRNYEKLFEQVC